MTIRKRVFFGGALALSICVLMGWFWSLGTVSAESAPTVRVTVVQGEAEVRTKNDTVWKPLSRVAEVQVGDEIRTGENGVAELYWGDHGVSRLDERTTLLVQQSAFDVSQPTFVLRVRVLTGRVWSRMRKLLDLQSGIEVQTPHVVATVRGTTFGVDLSSPTTSVAVTESVVALFSPSVTGTSVLVREGKIGMLSTSGTVFRVRDLPSQDEWLQAQKSADGQFDEVERKSIDQRMRAQSFMTPIWIVKLSESLHLKFARASDRPFLYAAYLNRRIAQSVRDAAYGRARFDADVRGLKTGYISSVRGRVLRQIQDALMIERSKKISEQNLEVLSALVRLRTSMLDSSPGNRQYAEALTLDDRIDDLLYRHPEDVPTKAFDMLRAIAAWKDIVDSDTSLSLDEKHVLDDKAEALRLRLIDLQVGVPSLATDVSGTSTSTVPVSVPSVGAQSSTSSPLAAAQLNTQPVDCVYRSVAVFAKPDTAVEVGQSVALSLYAVCPDGRTDNVTAQGVFRPANPADGRVVGSAFIPAKVGTVTVQGEFVQSGVKKTANASVHVVAPKTVRALQSVRVSTAGSTTLELGQSAPLSALATYSDGTTADVTYLCAWSTSDQRVGIVSNQRFYASSQPGTVLVTCSVTEGTITQTGSLTMTVLIGSGQHPTGGGSQPAPVVNPNRLLF